MEDSNTVYLEDIESATVYKRQSSTTSPASGSKPSESKSATVAGTSSTLKRQLTLTDMFSGAKKPAEPSAKKLKLTSSSQFSNYSLTPTSSLGSTAGSQRSGPMKLNSIPFSLTAFREKLTEEQNRLLSLEIEVMGKSW